MTVRQLQDIRMERSTNQGGFLSHFDGLWTSHHAIITFQRRGHLCKDKVVSPRHVLQSILIFSVTVNNSPIPKDHFPRYKTSNRCLATFGGSFQCSVVQYTLVIDSTTVFTTCCRIWKSTRIMILPIDRTVVSAPQPRRTSLPRT